MFKTGDACTINKLPTDKTWPIEWAASVGAIAFVVDTDNAPQRYRVHVPATGLTARFPGANIASLTPDRLTPEVLNAMSSVLVARFHVGPPAATGERRYVRVRADVPDGDAVDRIHFTPAMDTYRRQVGLAMDVVGSGVAVRFKDGCTYVFHERWLAHVSRADVEPTLRRALVAPHIGGMSALAAERSFVRTREGRFGMIVGGCATSRRSFVAFDDGVQALPDSTLTVVDDDETTLDVVTVATLSTTVARLFDEDDGTNDPRATIAALASRVAALTEELAQLRGEKRARTK